MKLKNADGKELLTLIDTLHSHQREQRHVSLSVCKVFNVI